MGFMHLNIHLQSHMVKVQSNLVIILVVTDEKKNKELSHICHNNILGEQHPYIS